MDTKFNQDGYRWVHTKDEMPTVPHYAVMEFGSIYIPGDERSEQCPGHGYPAETKSSRDYIVFANKEAWEIYVKLNRNKTMIALHVTPATIETHVTVSIKS